MSKRRYSEGAKGQLEWMDEMERIEQELFPDAVSRSEVIVCLKCEGHCQCKEEES